MIKRLLLVLFVFDLTAFCQAPKLDRQVAVTIDDLPAGMADRLPASDITAMTTKLLTTLRDQKIPVVGFVNEKKLYKPGEVDERIKALQMWLDYGFELGNHTFSHMSLNQRELKDWEDDVIQGESVTRMLLAQHKMRLRYFRHPYLDTGRDLETRRKADEFLIQRGYRIAPITLDGWDWAFAGIYEDAKKRNDTEMQQKIVKDYLAHHEASFAYSEQQSVKVVGYEPKQILLLHASNLEADHIGELLDLLRKRGYRFITLQDALGDPVYSLPDTYVGEEGTGWIDHWAITQGKVLQGAPVFPQWVIEQSKQLHLSTGQVSAETPN
jgi:peptidoglycan/xylan/chitin deacetylase (PgdA/CDA1 family)